MTQGLTYDQYVTQVAELLVVPPTETNFVTILPLMITYAENRIYKDLDLLITSSSLTGALTAGSRQLTISLTQPTGIFTVSEQMNIITPSTQTDPEMGARVPCLPVTKEFLDAVYGDSSLPARGTPIYFAPFNDDLFYFGPFPDASYTVEIVGTLRPNSLSDTNTTTFLSLYMPELLVAASMVYGTGYQRDWSAQSDDPRASQSWENQYQLLLQTTGAEEARKKYEGAAWSSQSAAKTATPNR